MEPSRAIRGGAARRSLCAEDSCPSSEWRCRGHASGSLFSRPPPCPKQGLSCWSSSLWETAALRDKLLFIQTFYFVIVCTHKQHCQALLRPENTVGRKESSWIGWAPARVTPCVLSPTWHNGRGYRCGFAPDTWGSRVTRGIPLREFFLLLNHTQSPLWAPQTSAKDSSLVLNPPPGKDS